MLTMQQREALHKNCEALNLNGLELYRAQCLRANQPEAATMVARVIEQRKAQVRAASVPFEVSGIARPASVAVQSVPETQPAYWTAERVKAAGKAVGIVVTGGLLVGYVIIPALVAALSALASVAVAVAPWVIGGGIIVSVIRSAMSGEKKTSEPYPAKPVGDTYNVYIGAGQTNIHHTNTP